jgi:serine/threonine protein kinase
MHLDIKPDNILMSFKSEADPLLPGEARHMLKIADFGLAELDREPVEHVAPTGTDKYMCPEMVIEKLLYVFSCRFSRLHPLSFFK